MHENANKRREIPLADNSGRANYLIFRNSYLTFVGYMLMHVKVLFNDKNVRTLPILRGSFWKIASFLRKFVQTLECLSTN